MKKIEYFKLPTGLMKNNLEFLLDREYFQRGFK